MAGGRPSKYKKEYCTGIAEFFSDDPYSKDDKKETPNDLPLFSMYAVSIGVCHDTLLEWTKVHPEFSEAYKKAKHLQENILIQNGLRGNYAPAFAIFTSKNILGWRDDKKENDLTDVELQTLRNLAQSSMAEQL